MGKVVSKIMGGGSVDKGAQKRALELQQKQLAQQEAMNLRAQQAADDDETKLSGQAASQRRAIAARQRSRGGLSFTGPSGNLKTTLGG